MPRPQIVDEQLARLRRRQMEAAHRAAATVPAEVMRVILTGHYLTGIECDHDTKRDRPSCACSRVDLGWHGSVGAAAQAWADHVMDVVALGDQHEAGGETDA